MTHSEKIFTEIELKTYEPQLKEENFPPWDVREKLFPNFEEKKWTAICLINLFVKRTFYRLFVSPVFLMSVYGTSFLIYPCHFITFCVSHHYLWKKFDFLKNKLFLWRSKRIFLCSSSFKICLNLSCIHVLRISCFSPSRCSKYLCKIAVVGFVLLEKFQIS